MCTKSTKLRAFQFQVLHRAVVTNVDLLKWKIKTEDLCTFCHRHPESLEHLLWECTISQILWTKVFVWLKSHTRINIRFTRTEVIIGCNDAVPLLYNLVFLVVKRYIYVCRCRDMCPSFTEWKQRMKLEYDTEKLSAEIYGYSNTFDMKWETLASAFS